MADAIEVSAKSRPQVGMLAKAFENSKLPVFATGVSNSACKDESEFKRERDLLPDAPVLYFGTCSDEDSPYVAHKSAMQEEVIRRGGMVLRLPTVAGRSKNPHTLINALYMKLVKREVIPIYEDAKRRVVDVDDVVCVAEKLGFQNRVFDVAPAESHYVIDILHALERVVGIEAQIGIREGGRDYPINPVPGDYLGVSEVLRKYYGW